MSKKVNNIQVFTAGCSVCGFDTAVTGEAISYVLETIRQLRIGGRVTKRRLSQACAVGEHRMARILRALDLEVELARINSEEPE